MIASYCFGCKKLGIELAPWEVFDSKNLQEDMIQYTKKWSEKISSYEYEIDGIVFKLDNLTSVKILGL